MLISDRDLNCAIQKALEQFRAEDKYVSTVSPFNPDTGMIELIMSDGTKVSLDMSTVISSAVSKAMAADKDKYVVAWQQYNPDTNIGKLLMSDGTTVDVDMTAVIADAVATSMSKLAPATESSAGIVKLGNRALANDGETVLGYFVTV